MKLEEFFEKPIQNIAELLDEEQLKKIYLQVSQKYQDDLSAMGDRIDRLRRAVKLASLIAERDSPFQGASNVVFPLAAMACIQYGATAYQALFPDDEIAKLKIIGSDAGKISKNDKGEEVIDPETKQPKIEFAGYKQEIGTRLTTTINYQLADELTYWKTDAVSSMFRLPALGTMFKKTYWDFILDQPCSRFIDPDKIIIDPSVKCIENNTYSEIIDVDKKTIASNVKRGLWKYDLEKQKTSAQATHTSPPQIKEDNQSPNSDLFQFIEQHTFLDLDEDGIDEPYCVVFDMGAMTVVRITPDFDLDGIKRTSEGKIYYVGRDESLIYFGFLPDFGGGFYSLGYAELLLNNNAAINTAINQMIDAANLKLKGGGFISTGIDLRGGSITFKLGEYKKVNSAGGNLAANVFPFPFPEPSPVLFSLLGLMIESGKEIGSLRDVLTGETAANMAPTTYMGLVEQGMRQSLAILKNNHESFKKELKFLRRLNSKYLSREKYAQIIDVDNPKDVSPQQDFSQKKVDLVLVTDSTAITSAQKFAQAQLLTTLKDDAYYNPIEIRKMFNEAIQMPKLNTIVAPPPPSPDANLVLAQAEDKKAQAKLAEADIKYQEMQAKIAQMVDQLQLQFADVKLKESQALKNIADAVATQKETTFKELESYENTITKRLEAQIKERAIEVQRELSTQKESNDRAEESAA